MPLEGQKAIGFFNFPGISLGGYTEDVIIIQGHGRAGEPSQRKLYLFWPATLAPAKGLKARTGKGARLEPAISPIL
jgi:hypothetical protein